MTVKITVPVGTLFRENVYLNSDAFTVTFVGAAASSSTLFVLAPPDGQEDPCEHSGERECRQPRDPGDTLDLNPSLSLRPSPVGARHA